MTARPSAGATLNRRSVPLCFPPAAPVGPVRAAMAAVVAPAARSLAFPAGPPRFPPVWGGLFFLVLDRLVALRD